MIDLNLVVILKRLDECRGTAPEIGMVSLAAALGAVDVHIGIAVSEEGHERYRLGLFVKREQDDGIRTSALCLAGLAVNAEEQNIDYILARILCAAVLRPRSYEAVDARSVADIIHSLKLLLGRKGALGITVAAVVDGNKSELIADIDAAADYSKGEHHADNGNRDFEIAFVVVQKNCLNVLFSFFSIKQLTFNSIRHIVSLFASKSYTNPTNLLFLYFWLFTQNVQNIKRANLRFYCTAEKFFRRMIS